MQSYIDYHKKKRKKEKELEKAKATTSTEAQNINKGRKDCIKKHHVDSSWYAFFWIQAGMHFERILFNPLSKVVNAISCLAMQWPPFLSPQFLLCS